MREIKLGTDGLIALVDDEDYERVSAFTWFANRASEKHIYAARKSGPYNKRRTLSMHRFIMELKHGDERVVDHINHNTLDNRKANLRVCSSAENSRNRLPKERKGVYWNKANQNWRVVLHIGSFDKIEDAIAKYAEVEAFLRP